MPTLGAKLLPGLPKNIPTQSQGHTGPFPSPSSAQKWTETLLLGSKTSFGERPIFLGQPSPKTLQRLGSFATAGPQTLSRFLGFFFEKPSFLQTKKKHKKGLSRGHFPQRMDEGLVQESDQSQAGC